MIQVNLKSGKIINLNYHDIKEMIQDRIETLVEDKVAHCVCILNETRSYCECDNGVVADDYIVADVSLVYEES